MVEFSLLAVISCDVSRLSLLGFIPHSSHPTVGSNFLVPGLEGDSASPVGEAEVSEPEEVNPVLEQEQRGLRRAGQPSLWGRECGCREVSPDSLPSSISNFWSFLCSRSFLRVGSLQKQAKEGTAGDLSWIGPGGHKGIRGEDQGAP